MLVLIGYFGFTDATHGEMLFFVVLFLESGLAKAGVLQGVEFD